MLWVSVRRSDIQTISQKIKLKVSVCLAFKLLCLVFKLLLIYFKIPYASMNYYRGINGKIINERILPTQVIIF